MKKLVLMIVMVVGVTAFAQEKKGERKGFSTAEKVERLTKELDLTTEQQAKVKEILEKKQETKKTERAEALAVKKEEKEAFDKEIKSVLTEEQVAKYDAKKKENLKVKKAKNLEKKK